MELILILLALYIVPLLYNRWKISRFYFHTKGRYHGLSPDLTDYIYALFPFLNLLAMFPILFMSWKDRRYRRKNNKFWITRYSYK